MVCVLLSAGLRAPAQNVAVPASKSGAAAEIVHLTLQDAIARARKLSPTLATALANARVAAEATVQARSAILPNVSGISQYLYTEGNDTPAARFIANNGVHEYVAQTDVHQVISGPLVIQYRRNVVLQAVAKDQAVMAERGLVVAVVQAYATDFGAEGKLKTSQETVQAAQHFLLITQQREDQGDAAHADVLKARIQADDSQSALTNAQLACEQAHIALALLIFHDVNQPFNVVEDPSETLQLPPESQAEREAATANPALDAAYQSRKAAEKDLDAARAGYMPTLTFDYYYGIDANHFATESTLRDGTRIQNLGYSALASLSLPIFAWGANHSRVKQAKSLAEVAQTSLNFAKQQAAGSFEQFYREAQVAGEDLKIREDAYRDSVESRRLTLLQYQAGVVTALEVVSAESAVETEGAALYDAKTRYATAVANLATLTGVL